MPERSTRRAVFLDRDGTLNVDTGYVARAGDVRLVDGAAEGAKALADAGYVLVIASNQSGIARGLMTAAQADAVDVRLREILRKRGVNIEASYRCPHLPTGSVAAYARECDCRKPKAGMLLQAAGELGLDLGASWIVGDRMRDVEAGHAVGARAVLITDQPQAVDASDGVPRVRNLLEASRIIIAAPVTHTI